MDEFDSGLCLTWHNSVNTSLRCVSAQHRVMTQLTQRMKTDLAMVVFLQGLGEFVEDAKPSGCVGGLPQQARTQAPIKAANAILGDDVLCHHQLHGNLKVRSLFW